MTESARPAAVAPTASTVVWLVGGLSMLQPLSTDLYLPTLPAIAVALSADVQSVQATLSVFIAAFGLWQLIAGPLSDRYGRAPVITAGAATYAAASLLCMLAPTIGVLLAGRALQAIGACSCLVGARGLVRDLYAPSQGARVLASAFTIMAFAPLIGPLLGAWLAELFGWRSAFAVVAAFGTVLVIACMLRLTETNRQPNRAALAVGPMLRGYAEIARSPAFRAYAVTAAATYAGLFAFISGSSFVLMRVLGQSATGFAFSFAQMVTGYLVGTLVCRRWIPRHGMQRTIALGAVLQAGAGVAMALLAIAGVHAPLAISLPMVVFGLSHGIVQPPTQSGAIAPFPQRAGAAAALLGAVMMLVAAAVGAWIGASYNATVYPLTLTVCGCALMTLATAFTLVRRHGDVTHHG
jgi:DHA1 family bicyclomycin/chloramphenicol resistance-like MFS transporter